MTSFYSSLDSMSHMALPNFKELGNVGTLMAMKGSLSRDHDSIQLFESKKEKVSTY